MKLNEVLITAKNTAFYGSIQTFLNQRLSQKFLSFSIKTLGKSNPNWSWQSLSVSMTLMLKSLIKIYFLHVQ